jgi:tRNA(Ile2) C34 agmatinyltransferase TiaS
MRYYVAFDDTDILDAHRGTGKLARWFEGCLPNDWSCRGVVRQQLPLLPGIPFTSHNSAACMMVDGPADPEPVCPLIADLAAAHIQKHFLDGSDPGLCVASHDQATHPRLMDFALRCTQEVVTRKDARAAARHLHLSAHGGTGDGIIGAAAAVALTASGWHGRFIEWQGLRDLPAQMKVSELSALGIRVVSLDRDACIPAPQERVATNGWVRPRLLGGEPVLWVRPAGSGAWENCDHRKRHSRDKHILAN